MLDIQRAGPWRSSIISFFSIELNSLLNLFCRWIEMVRGCCTNDLPNRSIYKFASYPAGIYLFKTNTRNNTTMREICSKLTINTPERPIWCSPDALVINFHTKLFCCFYCCFWTRKLNTSGYFWNQCVSVLQSFYYSLWFHWHLLVGVWESK